MKLIDVLQFQYPVDLDDSKWHPLNYENDLVQYHRAVGK